MARSGKIINCESGASALEFAIVGPVFMVLILGIISYGGYFWTSHTLQQTANNVARAALSGLTTTERQSLAQTVLAEDLQQYAFLDPAAASLTVDDQNDRLSIKLNYNASSSPFWAMGGLVPMPSATIVRTAVVRLGGY